MNRIKSVTASAKTLRALEQMIMRSAMYQYRQLCKRYGGQDYYLRSVERAQLTRGAKALIRACTRYAAALKRKRTGRR